jgi:hypothetical protein
MDRADDGLVGRVDDLKGFSIYAFDEFIVDKATLELVVVLRHEEYTTKKWL